ncbi:transcriptional regulator [Actinocorallia sp. API 0066]|uniref:transcriptional regulator n=1 Tax=Actinocorallia sp. API 0066 TaxID=2896846 RepID=UPI001E52C862|nr:transcriptional regulator [Actinocorallia sp. API 0066]MCD0449822.1 transcriptional regulator [Actinocorallia sp. API 0066]
MTEKPFGARLRARREGRDWSRPDLARRLRAVATEALPEMTSLVQMIKQWETGTHVPGRLYTGLLRRAFADPPVELDGDQRERLTLAVAKPARVDTAVVESFAQILAAQRRLDDTLGPAAILPAARVQAATAETLLREARGTVRAVLAPVVAEYVQFEGWLHAEMGDARRATHRLTEAECLADEAGSGVLAAQAANFKGYLARRQGNPRGVTRHFLTAYHTPGAHPAQRLGDAVQAAQGYALLGDATAARRLLNEGIALTGEATRELPPDTAYWLTPDFHNLNIGLALLALDEHAAADEHLSRGLETLPPDQRAAEWTQEYRDALAAAVERR